MPLTRSLPGRLKIHVNAFTPKSTTRFSSLALRTTRALAGVPPRRALHAFVIGLATIAAIAFGH